MGIRLVTTIFGLIAVVIILYFAPAWVAALAICILSAIAAYELLGATGELKGHALTYVSCIFAFIVPFITAYRPFDGSVLLSLFAFALCAFAFGVADHRHVTFEKVAMSFMAAFVIPYLLASLLRIYLSGELGKYYILMPCIAAWVSDMLAYLTGRAFGKHKLAPYVSPKKTVEGSIGGLLGAAVGLCIFGFVMDKNFGASFNLLTLFAAGILGGGAGQLGDLSMSLIKRNVGIKDFGKLFPGHGGVLDRFDSILFTAPLFELYLMAVNLI